MGYTTRYSLTLHPADDAMEIIHALRKQYDYADGCLTPEGKSNEPLTWYKHEEELKAFSKRCPKVRFVLHGEGEEAGDIWELHVQNGKSKRIKAEITPFPSPDDIKL